jgi:Protein of unknown function (DUF3891)
MIIQASRQGRARFVIRQVDHARLAGRFAAAFGNDTFAALDPQPLMEYMTAHHDEGWAGLDAAAPRDPETNLPYQFTETPRAMVVPVHARSAELNEQHHPFCGLLASMHVWGLYHGRYGLSERSGIDAVSPADKPAVLAMLQDELARQARLQTQFAKDPATQAWADDAVLFNCYQQLQFFDTLSLYFCMGDPAAPKQAVFRRVPLAVATDVTVTLRPLRPGFYGLSPYPFAEDFLQVSLTGRRLMPAPAQADLARTLAETPEETQTFTLVDSTTD